MRAHDALLHRHSSVTWVNSAIVILKLTILLVIITAGAFYVTAAYWHPFLPPNTGTFGEYGWSGVSRGAAVVFFAYIGFDAVSTASQEQRDASRTVPRGISSV